MRYKAAQTSQIRLQSLLPLLSRYSGVREHSPKVKALAVNSVAIPNLDGCHSPRRSSQQWVLLIPASLPPLPLCPHTGRVGYHCWLKCRCKGGGKNGYLTFAHIQGRLLRCWPANTKAVSSNRSSYFLIPRVSKGLNPTLVNWLVGSQCSLQEHA